MAKKKVMKKKMKKNAKQKKVIVKRVIKKKIKKITKKTKSKFLTKKKVKKKTIINKPRIDSLNSLERILKNLSPMDWSIAVVAMRPIVKSIQQNSELCVEDDCYQMKQLGHLCRLHYIQNWNDHKSNQAKNFEKLEECLKDYFKEYSKKKIMQFMELETESLTSQFLKTILTQEEEPDHTDDGEDEDFEIFDGKVSISEIDEAE
jgi:hypothetical protein